MAKRMKPATKILHSRADEVVPCEDSLALIFMSGLPDPGLIEVGQDHRLAGQESLEVLLRVVEGGRNHHD